MTDESVVVMKSQPMKHQVISKATLFIRQYNRRYVVDMDLSKCFDRLDHEIIIQQFRGKITDGSILKLLRQFLESGVMILVKSVAPYCGSLIP